MQDELPAEPQARGLFARLQVAVLMVYKRFVSPLLGPRCKYTPTCSVYAMQALARHGFVRGNLKIAWRLLRCAPWGQGGHDPA